MEKECKYCGYKGKKEYFVAQQNICRECNYIKNHQNKGLPNGYTSNEFHEALHYILNSELITCVNDLEEILNKNLKECIDLVKFVGSRNGNASLKVKYNCDYCGKVNKTRIFKYENNKLHFCNSECKVKYEKDKNKEYRETNKEYKNCICKMCGKEFHRKPSWIIKNDTNLCSVKCRKEWYKNEYVKREEVIKRNREIALNNLKNGVWDTNSEIQIIINNVLDNLDINYTNEYIIGKYAIDNYLDDYDIAIEINGGYWHCDPRIYDNINYEAQRKRIYSDKSKNSYCIKRDIKILYLWEYDILNNIELCKKIIKKFIKNKGILEEYNSMNYYIDNKNRLQLNKDRIKPYIEYTKEDLKRITNLEVVYKKEYYEFSQCKMCGEDIVFLKSKRHSDNKFCSRKCSDDYKLKIGEEKAIYFKCDTCGKEVRKTPSIYNIHKNHFCSKECYDIFQKRDRNEVVCENCNIKFSVPNHKIKSNKSGKYYCCKECYLENRKKQGRIIYNCDYCGKKSTTTSYNYKQSKFHFCSVKCSNTFKNKKLKKSQST